MNLLISSITNAQPEVLSAHLKSLQAQDIPEGWSVDFYYLVDPSADEGVTETLDAESVPWAFASDKPAEAVHEVTSVSHAWNEHTFYWLARNKQSLLDKAAAEGYDAIWLVDSDLICGPDTLASLIVAEKPVISGVFWTRWQPDAPPLPQVWMRHPYEFDGKGKTAHEFLEALANRGLVRVGGLGACTLIRASALSGVRYWPLIDGLPKHGMWQGEDRHFCVHAQRNHIELWADGWPDIFHVYRPEDVEKIPEMLQAVDPEVEVFEIWEKGAEEPRYELSRPSLGDLVRVMIEPLEEPELSTMRRHIRGRLGTLPVLPDIEDELASMSVGEERIIRARFPIWYPIEQYRGKDRLLRLSLLAAKPFRYAPTLHDASTAADRTLFSVRRSAVDEPVPLG